MQIFCFAWKQHWQVNEIISCEHYHEQKTKNNCQNMCRKYGKIWFTSIEFNFTKRFLAEVIGIYFTTIFNFSVSISLLHLTMYVTFFMVMFFSTIPYFPTFHLDGWHRTEFSRLRATDIYIPDLNSRLAASRIKMQTDCSSRGSILNENKIMFTIRWQNVITENVQRKSSLGKSSRSRSFRERKWAFLSSQSERKIVKIL